MRRSAAAARGADIAARCPYRAKQMQGTAAKTKLLTVRNLITPCPSTTLSSQAFKRHAKTSETSRRQGRPGGPSSASPTSRNRISKSAPDIGNKPGTNPVRRASSASPTSRTQISTSNPHTGNQPGTTPLQPHPNHTLRLASDAKIQNR